MTEKKIEHCSFCGKHKNSVGTLIVGEDVAICNTCVEGCDKLIKNKQGSVKLISSVVFAKLFNLNFSLIVYISLIQF